MNSRNVLCSALQELESSLYETVSSKSIINGPDYMDMNKLLAVGYSEAGNEDNTIFHLTESHAPTLRNELLIRSSDNQSRKKKQDATFSDSLPTELQTSYIEFNNVYFKNGFIGVTERLSEMPVEWTIVQLTYQRDPSMKHLLYSENNTSPHMLKLHLTRLPCGQLTHERGLNTVLVDPRRGGASEEMDSILQIICNAIKNHQSRIANATEKVKVRKKASNDIKSMVVEIGRIWLKEWSSLIIGTLCDDKLKGLVTAAVDNVLNTDRKNRRKISKSKLSLLYQIADGCAHLSDSDIKSGVNYCIGDVGQRLYDSLVTSICQLKQEYSHKLMVALRNPVLLIIDDKLDFVPWEMTPILSKHPVSRVPSLHFVHAMYHRHKDCIVNGNRIIKDSDAAFYIINPSNDLTKTTELLGTFIEKRFPNWSGVKGETPNQDMIVKNLCDNEVFLYAGHGSGSQYLRPEAVYKLNINVLPLLFGCSSAAKRELGGKNELFGVSDHFLLSGCPCLIGMLYSVTSTDTDLVTMKLLNMCMAGNPVDINDIVGSEELDTSNMFNKQSELLRSLKVARNTAKLFINQVAVIARGIPIKFEE